MQVKDLSKLYKYLYILKPQNNSCFEAFFVNPFLIKGNILVLIEFKKTNLCVKKILMLMFLFLGDRMYSQFESKIYVHQSVSLGNNLGLDLGLTFVDKKDCSYTLGVKTQFAFIRNYPSNNLEEEFLFSDIENLTGLYFLAGKVFDVNKTFRYNLQAGLAYSHFSTKDNFVRVFGPGVSYYTYELVEKSLLSVVLKPKIELTAPQVIGLYVYGEVVANFERRYIGVGLGYMLGKVR